MEDSAILRVALQHCAYDIVIGRGVLSETGARVQALHARRCLLVTDAHVDALYGARVLASLEAAGLAATKVVLPPGEETKSLNWLSHLYTALNGAGLTRSDVVVALGGGVVGDLAGFAAATYLRGIRYVQLPTTLLAQVDSAVGGKTAIDLPAGKNLVGAFHQPALVLADGDALQTLPDREFMSGMGEVIKYALAFDRPLYQSLMALDAPRQGVLKQSAAIVRVCLEHKRRVVEADERDTGARMALNLGHTLGHAIEAAQRYEGLTHGEAVAAGICLMTRLTEHMGLSAPGTATASEAIAARFGLPTTVEASLWPAMREALAHDKKHLDGALHIVLLASVGACRIEKIDASALEGVTKWLR